MPAQQGSGFLWERGRLRVGSRGQRGGSGAPKVALALAALKLLGSPSAGIFELGVN